MVVARSTESTTAISCRSCMPCKMSCTSSRLSCLSLCGLLVSSVVLSQRGHRLYNSRLPCCRLVLRLRQSFLALNPVLRHCIQYVLSCLTVFRRLLSAQLIIILLISGIFCNTCYHCRRFGLSTGNNTLSSSSACSVIALASALASWSFQPSLRGFC